MVKNLTNGCIIQTCSTMLLNKEIQMAKALVKIKQGVWRGRTVVNTVFPMLKPYQVKTTTGFITVDGSDVFGTECNVIRVKVKSTSDFEVLNEQTVSEQVQTVDPTIEPIQVEETDEEIMARIENRFSILTEVSRAICEGKIRAAIVTGAPGVGKSYIVENELERASLIDILRDTRIRSEFVKGAITPIGLYQKLYEFSDPENVLVFDDSDMVFFDDISLNLLKAALDTSKRRKICWNGESHALRREGIPDQFDFKGSVIFITNLNFCNIKSPKLRDHLAALESRCHFIDLTINTTREKLLRIKQIANAGELFVNYEFTPEQQIEVIDFLFANQANLRELSLRTALKIADLYSAFPDKWQDMAKVTVMKNARA
jgi:hypothetical protein